MGGLGPKPSGGGGGGDSESDWPEIRMSAGRTGHVVCFVKLQLNLIGLCS